MSIEDVFRALIEQDTSRATCKYGHDHRHTPVIASSYPRSSPGKTPRPIFHCRSHKVIQRPDDWTDYANIVAATANRHVLPCRECFRALAIAFDSFIADILPQTRRR